MKWVKVAIGAVIAISVVPIIALSVFNLTQEKVKEEVVTFEVLTYSDLSGTITQGTYDEIRLYAIINIDIITNITSYKKNGIETDSIKDNNINRNRIELYWYTNNENDDTILVVSNDDSFIEEESVSSPVVSDTFEITFEVTTPPAVSGVTATLIALTPLIFVGGVLSYFLVKTNLKKED